MSDYEKGYTDGYAAGLEEGRALARAEAVARDAGGEFIAAAAGLMDVVQQAKAMLAAHVEDAKRLAVAGSKGLPVFIDVPFVVRTYGCSTTTARRHLRAATGRRVGTGELLRATAEQWRAHVDGGMQWRRIGMDGHA